jgi:hypothetical protein
MESISSGILRRARATLICALISAVGTLSSSISPAATVNTAFGWGAVGHNDYATYDLTKSYSAISLPAQMQLLTSSGMSWYRTNCQSISCPQLISAAAASGIKVLKSTGLVPDPTLDEAANYSRAYSFAVSDGHNQSFKYYEAGNELDNWVGMVGDGSARAQYSVPRYLQARGFVRGMIDGLHSANPGAKVVVADAGWCHYGFLEMLWQDGVQWDITGVHWYSDQGNIEHAGCNATNVAAKHAAFGLPVWITEYNAKIANSDPVAQAAWLSTFITQIKSIATTYDIQAAFVYELLDESNLTGPNSHYGMFHADGSPKIAIGAMIKGYPVSLTSAANVNGVFGNGREVTNGGMDDYSYAYSAALLGTSLTSGGVTFELLGAGVPDAISDATVTLPAGKFSTLNLLAIGVRGNQANQPFTVKYTDGTTSTISRSLSDWHTPQSYAGESMAATMAYRLDRTGATDSQAVHVYGYSLAIDKTKTVQSVALPRNRNVVVLAATLAP